MRKLIITAIVAIPVIYYSTSRIIIKKIYENNFFGILDGIITGQKEHSLNYYYEIIDRFFYLNIIPLFLLIPIIFFVFRPKTITNNPLLEKWMHNHSEHIDSIPSDKLGFWIAFAAGLGIFLELSIIRIHSSFFTVFSIFKNISLLSCFLGLGIGYARGKKQLLTTHFILPLLSVQLVFLYTIKGPLYSLLSNPITEQFSMGLRQADSVYSKAFILTFIILIFAFNSLCFIPLGQLVARLMNRKPKLEAYSWNLIGSLIAIIIFSVFSYILLPPVLWIVVFSFGLLTFIHQDHKPLYYSILSIIIALIILSIPSKINELEIHSPYQKLTLRADRFGKNHIRTNDRYYQKIYNLDQKTARAFNTNRQDTLNEIENIGQSYSLPYFFQNNLEDVLILASGSGNDIATALANRSQNIDAVEIDPVIQKMGNMIHPQSPYSSEKVTTYIDDARAFLKKGYKKYDLIIFGLLDAHSLLSGQSSGIRLDSYVYTVESFREARQRLKKDGLICLSFATMGSNIAKKLFVMLEEAFDGKKPTVYRTKGYGTAYLIGNKDLTDLKTVYKTFPDISNELELNDAFVDKATDNWPFFYMPKKVYPYTYLVLILLVIIISIVYVNKLSKSSLNSFSFPCFFLGAGFMLIETKGITELSLYFGSTWVVISIVVSAILTMAFFANLIIQKIKTPHPFLIYGNLFLFILIGLLYTFVRENIEIAFRLDQFIGTILLTIPLFFSGFAFSYELKKSHSINIALSSNLIGAMVGGCLEYNTIYFGFRFLYILIILMYLLSFITSTFFNKKVV